MLKIVVFDSGFGGELFADRLAAEFPVAEIIRVINWRAADQILSGSHAARKIAEESLRPYIGKVDLIVFANYLLSLTSLRYFRRKYKHQKFLGLKLKRPDTFRKRDVLILSTKAVSRTLRYHSFCFRLKRNIKTINLDSWPSKIDDGELSPAEINSCFTIFLSHHPSFNPQEIILASSQFNDISENLKSFFGQNLKIYDGFDDAIRKIGQLLTIRGGLGKKRK